MRSIGYCVTVIIAWRDGLRSNYDLGRGKGKHWPRMAFMLASVGGQGEGQAELLVVPVGIALTGWRDVLAVASLV